MREFLHLRASDRTGWYVHEWLWRNNVPDLNEKSADIQTIYTATDAETVKKLISRYDISYIFVGGQEKRKIRNRA